MKVVQENQSDNHHKWTDTLHSTAATSLLEFYLQTPCSLPHLDHTHRTHTQNSTDFFLSWALVKQSNSLTDYWFCFWYLLILTSKITEITCSWERCFSVCICSSRWGTNHFTCCECSLTVTCAYRFSLLSISVVLTWTTRGDSKDWTNFQRSVCLSKPWTISCKAAKMHPVQLKWLKMTLWL